MKRIELTLLKKLYLDAKLVHYLDENPENEAKLRLAEDRLIEWAIRELPLSYDDDEKVKRMTPEYIAAIAEAERDEFIDLMILL